jgi:hypothetical protein
MKTIIKQQIIIIVLFFLIVFQSCATYYKNSFPQALEKVSNKDRAVEILTTKGEKLKYRNIVVSNDEYYGITKKKTSTDTIPINISTIKEMKIKNSTVLNILEFIGKVMIAGIVLYVWVDSGFDFNYEN